MINRARPISDYANEVPETVQNEQKPLTGKLYLKLPSEDSLEFAKTRAILNMFPGESAVVLYFADTGVRRGTHCGLRENMMLELQRLLGKENVVLK